MTYEYTSWDCGDTRAALTAFRRHLAALFPDHAHTCAKNASFAHTGAVDSMGVEGGREAASLPRADASWAEEELYVNFLLLLLYAMRQSLVTLGGLREWLCEAMHRFPYNAVMFMVFVHVEERFGLSHRVRWHWERTWEGGEGVTPLRASLTYDYG